MTALVLRSLLAEADIEVLALARHCQLSRTMASRLVNHGAWPTRRNEGELRQRINGFLQSHGLCHRHAFRKEKAPTRSNAPRPCAPPTAKSGDDEMLPRKISLTPQARQHFRITRDPFIDCRELDDVFMTPDIRYVREAIRSACKHNGFLAVIGESGAGKTTLFEELQERLHDDAGTVLIKPYVLAMEGTDATGKTLRSQHIAEAAMRQIAPLARCASSPDARFAQVHRALIDSSRNGRNHVIVIEEAHAVPVPTLRHLKRWMELKDRMRPLCAAVLFAQPELEAKLADPALREVAQRIELVHLPPLDNHLAAYLKHRLARFGVDVANVIDDAGIEAIRARLTTTGKGQRNGSMVYPQAVHNVLAACMNAAANLGAPNVTRELVGGVL
jgi:type II secretory pathway predicted ATPase ExeA